MDLERVECIPMNTRAVSLVVAFVLFLYAAALAADWAKFGTHDVIVDLGLAAVVGYWFFTDHPPVRR